MRALIIDDDPDIVGLLRCLLLDGPEPYEVLTAATLSGAAVLLDQRAVDVVLSAAELPDARGREVVASLVAHHPNLPVLIHAEDAARVVDLIDHGAEDVVDPTRTSREDLHRMLAHARRRRARPRPATSRDHEDLARLLLGQYTRAVAHDIRRPLTAVQMLAQGIVNGHDRDPADLARRIVDRTDGLLAFTDVLLTDSVADDSTVRDVSLAELVARALDLHGWADTSLVSVDVPDDLRVVGREGQLLHAVLNLLGNVAQHAGPTANVAITGRVRDGSVLLTVDDDGPGVPVEDRDRILAPGTRLVDGHGGHGLGLAAVDLVARLHGGRTLVDDSPLGGLRVGLAIPSRTGTARPRVLEEHRD